MFVNETKKPLCFYWSSECFYIYGYRTLSNCRQHRKSQSTSALWQQDLCRAARRYLTLKAIHSFGSLHVAILTIHSTFDQGVRPVATSVGQRIAKMMGCRLKRDNCCAPVLLCITLIDAPCTSEASHVNVLSEWHRTDFAADRAALPQNTRRSVLQQVSH